jgi:phosphoribosylaminoimidazolecarboxamide formyltransferase/IMP cyclohydrolase
LEAKKINRALISVFYKDGLLPLITELAACGTEFYSTGGTWQFITGAGFDCKKVEDLTGYPSILGGRVKTLHPKVFGGILARREEKDDLSQLEEYAIPEFDLVIVDLYPFDETVKSGASPEEIIEKIDIGGVSLIRAAAKNYKDVCIVSNRNQYAALLGIVKKSGGTTLPEQRREFAAAAFANTSEYDTLIASWFADNKEELSIRLKGSESLRYGENPHQKGTYHGCMDGIFEKLHGKEISYNNLLDIDAAVGLAEEFTEPVFAVIKHNNACGIASHSDLTEAWKRALAGDPVSAFGGVIVTNRPIDEKTAEEMNSLFFEVLIAPAYEGKSLETLFSKKNRIILRLKKYPKRSTLFRSVLDGMLAQEPDRAVADAMTAKFVTTLKPTDAELDDLLFGEKVVKHTRSNAIVLVKNKQLMAGIGGQTSRVDALKQAIDKAGAFGFDLNGAVMASDAFFPFPDCVEIAHKAGVTAVIQPGGSVRDNESVDYCNKNGMKMIFTGLRHFKH